MHDNSLNPPKTTLYLCAAVLTENRVYVKRHLSVRPSSRWTDHSVPQFFFSQHDVSLELATPLARTLQFRDICNKTYGNFLCVATGCSSCKNSPSCRVEQLCTWSISVICTFKWTHTFMLENYITNILKCFGTCALSSGSLHIVFAEVIKKEMLLKLICPCR
jgi:hypothetical protein